MADAQRRGLVFSTGCRSEPLAIAGQYLRAAFPTMESETLDREVTKLLMHLSHQPYERQSGSG